MKKNGYTNSAIANTIGKDKTTIGRELKRNSDSRNGVYKSELAQRKADIRKNEKPKKIKLTPELKDHIISKIKED